MNKELKYPIKYAVLELKESSGWSHNYEDITIGFIISKCYVIESSTKYLSNGSTKTNHKVIFPFTNISDFRTSLKLGIPYNPKRNIPSFDFNGNPYSTDTVENLYDNYEDALIEAYEKNKELKDKLSLKISLLDEDWKKKYEQSKQEFLERLDICHKFEEFLNLKTIDMNISNNQLETNYKKLKRDKSI